MPAVFATHQQFDDLSFHDNLIYGVRFDIGDPDRGTWHSDLVLDIDHITEWVCEGERDNRTFRFRVAPATLTFHNVTDLVINIAFGDTGLQTNLNEASIDRVERTLQPEAEQKICLDQPYWRWCIALNWPKGGEITFGASGFELDLRAEPTLTDQQRLGRT